MSWFKKIKDKAKQQLLPSPQRKDTPDGVWTRCPSCKEMLSIIDLEQNWHVCPNCNYHFRVGSEVYFKLLFDNGKYEELFDALESVDFLGFVDRKPYAQRLEEAKKKTGLKEAIRIATGNIGRNKMVVAAMDFDFIGGSMGSVVGEKFTRAAEYALEHEIPLIAIPKSGGARMMESAFSLMQMAKTSAILTKLSEKGIPYWVILTDPTTGGVTASFAMLGDVNIAEPGALIGFAGPRVIEQTIRKKLPPGFQRSEFLLEHGLVDIIVPRHKLKDTIIRLYKFYKY